MVNQQRRGERPISCRLVYVFLPWSVKTRCVCRMLLLLFGIRCLDRAVFCLPPVLLYRMTPLTTTNGRRKWSRSSERCARSASTRCVCVYVRLHDLKTTAHLLCILGTRLHSNTSRRASPNESASFLPSEHAQTTYHPSLRASLSFT